MPKILALSGGSTAAVGTVTAPVALTTNVIPKASGAATITDSALTDNGTTVTSTEPIVVPTGSGGNNTGGLQFAAGVALYQNGTTLAAWNNDIVKPVWGMGEDGSFTVPTASTTSTGLIGWTNSSTSVHTPLTDTAFSRSAGGKVSLGNGTAGDASGTLNCARVNTALIDTLSGGMTIATGDGFSAISIAPGGNTVFAANANGASVQLGKVATFLPLSGAVTLVDNGIPFQTGHLDLTAQVAAISATTIFTPTATGRFRISVYEKVTTAASVSSVLGGASGTTITYTDGTDSVAQSVVMAMDTAAGAVALTAAGNSTTTILTGTTYIYALVAVPIQIAVGYTSSGTAMAFAVRATCESL